MKRGGERLGGHANQRQIHTPLGRYPVEDRRNDHRTSVFTFHARHMRLHCLGQRLRDGHGTITNNQQGLRLK